MQKDIIFENEYIDDTLSAADPLLRLVSSQSDAAKRVDVFISENTGLTRSAVARLIESGSVKVEGFDKPLAKNYKIRIGDVLYVEIPEPTPSEALPEDIPLDIVYEDRDIVLTRLC